MPDAGTWFACEYPERPMDLHRAFHVCLTELKDRPCRGCVVMCQSAVARGEEPVTLLPFIDGTWRSSLRS